MGDKNQHALLSASGAKKWINCPPSARLEEKFPERTSEYAEEGTLAHDMCELKLRKLFTETGMSETTYKRRLNKLKKHEKYQKEMDGYTDSYVDYVSGIAYSCASTPYMAIEKEVRYDAYAQEGFGRADCIIIYGTHLHVADFKYGQGIPVYADHNPQMMMYALGAVAAYGFIYPIQEITVHIIQPRVSSTASSYHLSITELLDWGDTVVKPAARLAWEGAGEFKQGEWCDKCFCAAAGCCECRAKENLELFDRAHMPVGALSCTDLGEVLTKGRFVASWVKKVESFALESILKGYEIPGWKAVEGKSVRKIDNVDTAFEALVKAGYAEDILYESKPITLTAVEKLINSEDRKILEPYITKPPGKPTLAEESDRRKPYVDSSAESAFGGENLYKEEHANEQ